MKLDRQYSSKKKTKLGIFSLITCSFFIRKFIIVNHHCCGYQVMSKRWYETEWRVQPLKNGVNHFYNIHEAIKWIDKGCPIDDIYVTKVMWES